MIARVLIAAVVVLAVVQVKSVPVEPNPHDLVQCDNQPGDTDLAYAQIVDEGHYLGKVDIDFIYPPEGAPQNKIINCIKIIDLKPDLGGTAAVVDGGLKHTNVTIKINSAFTKGVSYSIKIEGQARKG
ncbi:hypothetical protein J437_LFUL016895 [Ladona fulva]|uniref:Uncharacterized protein n=1 Tax=Ladona fulva TaxID=123851 RepID=A0A8K0KMH3_LADFU|nr:hypothetical protein J437_LFUL016895 [Ladona fulva]